MSTDRDHVQGEGFLRGLRECGLRLDREGQWLHEGSPVTHPGLAAALHRWIDRDDESGRYVVRAGSQTCLIEVEDAPFIVRGVRLDRTSGDLEVTLRLSDETEEPLDYGTLSQSERNVLYCDVKAGRFPARFSRTAYFLLAEQLELDGDEPRLRAAGRLWPIKDRTEPAG